MYCFQVIDKALTLRSNRIFRVFLWHRCWFRWFSLQTLWNLKVKYPAESLRAFTSCKLHENMILITWIWSCYLWVYFVEFFLRTLVVFLEKKFNLISHFRTASLYCGKARDFQDVVKPANEEAFNLRSKWAFMVIASILSLSLVTPMSCLVLIV